jgi:hypothetical protein
LIKKWGIFTTKKNHWPQVRPPKKEKKGEKKKDSQISRSGFDI